MDKLPRPSKTDVFLNYKIWLSGLTGHGQVEEETFNLLEQTQQHGSLSAAANALQISYRKAWGKIQDAEKILGYTLLNKQRGGKDGGNSQLTKDAMKLLEAYRTLQQKFDDSVETAFITFLKAIKKEENE